MTASLASMESALAQLRDGQIGAQEFSRQVRAQTELLAALPPRYGEVLLQLLTRLESSALFSEESCSFSQNALLEHLLAWVDKARERLAAAPC